MISSHLLCHRRCASNRRRRLGFWSWSCSACARKGTPCGRSCAPPRRSTRRSRRAGFWGGFGALELYPGCGWVAWVGRGRNTKYAQGCGSAPLLSGSSVLSKLPFPSSVSPSNRRPLCRREWPASGALKTLIILKCTPPTHSSPRLAPAHQNCRTAARITRQITSEVTLVHRSTHQNINALTRVPPPLSSLPHQEGRGGVPAARARARGRERPAEGRAAQEGGGGGAGR